MEVKIKPEERRFTILKLLGPSRNEEEALNLEKKLKVTYGGELLYEDTFLGLFFRLGHNGPLV